MILLGVNIDHVATVREARGGSEPDVIAAARDAMRAGANGITVHLREDRRHIQDHDVRALKKIVRVKFNLEMALSDDIISMALKVKPDQITLVPEKRRELTTEGGLDVIKKRRNIAHILPLFRKKGIEVSLFVDPDLQQVDTAARLGVDAVELHTGTYAEAYKRRRHHKAFAALRAAEKRAHALGLIVHAGHGLDYTNIKPIMTMPHIQEVNIGHSLVAHAISVGLYNAVKRMKHVLATKIG